MVHMAQETTNMLHEFFNNQLINVGLWPPHSLRLPFSQFFPLNELEGSGLLQPPANFGCFTSEHHSGNQHNYLGNVATYLAEYGAALGPAFGLMAVISSICCSFERMKEYYSLFNQIHTFSDFCKFFIVVCTI